MDISFIDISGCSTVSYYIVKVHLFFKELATFFILLFPSWCCTREKEKKSQTRQQQLDKKHLMRDGEMTPRDWDLPFSESNFLKYVWSFLASKTEQCELWSLECCCSEQRSPGAKVDAGFCLPVNTVVILSFFFCCVSVTAVVFCWALRMTCLRTEQ